MNCSNKHETGSLPCSKDKSHEIITRVYSSTKISVSLPSQIHYEGTAHAGLDSQTNPIPYLYPTPTSPVVQTHQFQYYDALPIQPGQIFYLLTNPRCVFARLSPWSRKVNALHPCSLTGTSLDRSQVCNRQGLRCSSCSPVSLLPLLGRLYTPSVSCRQFELFTAASCFGGRTLRKPALPRV